MPMTVTIEDDLAKQLRPYEAQFPQVIELGIRELRARAEPGYQSVSSFLEKLASLPSPEEVLALRPTPALQERIDALLEKNRAAGLAAMELLEWDQYAYLEHLVRLAKANALRTLNGSHE